MTYVVTEPCIKCKNTECVDVCPVECFHEGPNFVVIDPEWCIDCGACEPVCPTEAIFRLEDVPGEWSEYVQLNATLAQRWPSIYDCREPLPEAQRWQQVKHKREYLEGDTALAPPEAATKQR